MMRWIVASSLKFRLLVVGVAAATDDRRRLAAPQDAGGRPARVRARHRRGPDRGARALVRGGGAADHRSDRAGPAERHRVPQGHPFASRCRGCHGSSSSSSPGPTSSQARQVVAERMTQAHALPNVSKPPQILQPLSSTNRVMMVGGQLEARCPRSRCRCSPAGRSCPACWACPASPTSPSGASATGSCRCRSTRSVCAAQTSRCSR